MQRFHTALSDTEIEACLRQAGLQVKWRDGAFLVRRPAPLPFVAYRLAVTGRVEGASGRQRVVVLAPRLGFAGIALFVGGALAAGGFWEALTTGVSQSTLELWLVGSAMVFGLPAIVLSRGYRTTVAAIVRTLDLRAAPEGDDPTSF